MKKIMFALAAITALFMPAISECSELRKIVTFNEEMSAPERRLAVERLGGKVVKEYETLNSIVAVFTDDAIKNVKLLSGDATIETDTYRKWINSGYSNFPQIPIPSVSEIIHSAKLQNSKIPAAMPSEAGKNSTQSGAAQWLGWFLDGEIPWGINRINAPKVWTKNQGEGIKVGIIDTGVYTAHADLAGRIAGGFNAIKPGASPEDDNGHGTHVAGTIAANLDSKGVVGVAPKAALYAVKVLDADGGGTDSDVIAGIDWCIKNKIQIINMSLGTDENVEALRHAVERAYKAGVTVVCAAGNSSGPVGYPAAYPQAIAVSASSIFDMRATYSCYGPEVDFIAPGSYITSTFKGGGYARLFGTSMACPHVAGLAALAISAGAKGPDAVLKILTKAAVPIPGLIKETQGAGMIDAAKIEP